MYKVKPYSNVMQILLHKAKCLWYFMASIWCQIFFQTTQTIENIAKLQEKSES